MAWWMAYASPPRLHHDLARQPNHPLPSSSPLVLPLQVRLFFLLCWFHALVTERLRYVPLGWSHKYEFSQVRPSALLITRA